MTDRTELVEFLLRTGAVINSDSNEKFSPLYDVITHLAEDKKGNRQNILPLVSVLIRHGFDPNYSSDKRRQNFNTMVLLGHLGLPFNPRFIDVEYENVAMAALKYADSEVLQTILDAGGKLENLQVCPFEECFRATGMK